MENKKIKLKEQKDRNEMIIERKINQQELENLIKDIEKRVDGIELNKKIEINEEYTLEIQEKNPIIPFKNSTKKTGNYIILKVEKKGSSRYLKKNTVNPTSQPLVNTSEIEVDKRGYMVANISICPLGQKEGTLPYINLTNATNFKNDKTPLDIKLKVLKSYKSGYLNIGVDTEYQEYINKKGVVKRFLISTQLSFTFDGENYINFIFFNNRLDKFKITQYLQYIIKYLDNNNLYNFACYNKKKGVEKIINKIRMNLIYHFTRADLTMFTDFKKILKRENLKGIQKSLITFNPDVTTIHVFNFDSLCNTYELSINVRDTMNYLVGDKSLKGASYLSNIGKLDIEDEHDKSNMIDFLLIDIEKFIKYGVLDSITTVDIANNLIGLNTSLPPTITSLSVKTFKEFFMKEHSIKDKKDFIFKYKGQIDHKETGLVEDKEGFFEGKDYREKSYSWETAHNLARDSYCGGANQCYYRGIYNKPTIDFDLKNAYPTMMSTIPMIDYEQEPNILLNPNLTVVFNMLHERQIFSLDVAEVDFDFNNVKDEYEEYKYFPFIPIKAIGSLIFPMKGKNVKISGAELYRALQIGAITHIHIFCKIPTLKKMDDIGQIVDYPIFKNYMKYCVNERAKYEKGSPQNTVWKLNANSTYGATAQGLSGSKSNIYHKDKKERETLPPGEITNPIYANSITAICRVVLHDVMASIRKKGGYTLSVTTDGFISTANENEINTILLDNDLTKFTHIVLANTRYELDGKYEYFEKKHEQKQTLSIATRGNRGLNSENGVNARLGIKSLTGDEIVEKYVNNEFIINDEFEKPINIDKVLYNEEEFTFQKEIKKIKLEYDFKRRTTEDMLNTIEYEHKGENKKILIFDTIPWETKEDFIKNKKRMQKDFEKNKKIIASDKKTITSFLKKSKFLDNENVKVKFKEEDQFLVRCFVAQYSQNKIEDIEIIKYFSKLSVQEQIDILNKTVKKKNFLTKDNRHKIIQRVGKGLLYELLEQDLTEYLEILRNKIKEEF